MSDNPGNPLGIIVRELLYISLMISDGSIEPLSLFFSIKILAISSMIASTLAFLSSTPNSIFLCSIASLTAATTLAIIKVVLNERIN